MFFKYLKADQIVYFEFIDLTFLENWVNKRLEGGKRYLDLRQRILTLTNGDDFQTFGR